MEIEKLAAMIHGEFRDTGLHKEVNNATVFAQNTEIGGVCFVESQDEADMAVKNGVYALVVEDADILVAENVAKILVEDIKKAAFILIGYAVREDDASFELITPKQWTFLQMILNHKRDVGWIPDDWKKAFEFILNSPKRLFIGTDEEMLKMIRPKLMVFSQKADGHIVSSDSLFRTTFKIEKYIYQYKQMAPFHITLLRQMVALCNQHGLSYAIDKVTYTKHFRPIFLEGEPSIQEVMKNDKVVILSDNLEDIIEAKMYAGNVGQWMAKSIVLTPPKTKVEGVKVPVRYRRNEDILDAIQQLSYNYLFVYTDDKNIASLIERSLQ